MYAWELPSALDVGGSFFYIRTDYRVVLRILKYNADPDYESDEKAIITLKLLFIDWESIPESLYQEAIAAACAFIDMGAGGDSKSGDSHRLMDWEQDASMIISAVNKVLGYDIRRPESLHWWTFLSAYFEIGDSLYSTVLHLRKKRIKNEPLEKHERRFINENPELFALKSQYSENDKMLLAEWGVPVE